MIDNTSYGYDVANELSLDGYPYGNEVAGEVSLTSAAYGNEVATAINERPTEPVTIRVLQYNIGHFNMGYAAAPTGNNPTTSTVLINSNKSDGYPNSIDRNYAIQLQRWKDRINGIKADIIGMPEWNNYFGYNNGSVVSALDSGIFDDYPYISVGPTECNGWWQNTIASKYPLINTESYYLGSINNILAYVQMATIRVGGKSVKVGATHLNWNNPTGTGGASQAYTSRQKELKEIVKLMDDIPYLIIMGDFNTTGPINGTAWEGLQEFGIFKDGFTENGTTYQGGATLANSTDNPLLTSPASNSRPDLSGTQPKVPNSYIDNIIVKGFTMSNITVIDDGTITDHCGLYCDLTLIEEGGGQ